MSLYEIFVMSILVLAIFNLPPIFIENDQDKNNDGFEQ